MGPLAGGAGQQPGSLWDTRFPSAGTGELAGHRSGRDWHNPPTVEIP